VRGKFYHIPPYTIDKARVIILEMADHLSYRLVKKGVVTDQLAISIGYESPKEKNVSKASSFELGDSKAEISGRINLDRYTSSSNHFIIQSVALFDQMVSSGLLIRKITTTASHILPDKERQLDLFGDIAKDQKELRLQQTVLAIKAKFGKNSILKGVNLLDGATMKESNNKIGGHNA